MNVGIAGLGLIGGSLALALKTRHTVTGYDVDAKSRDAARAAGIKVVDSLDELLPADVAIVATPLASVVTTLASLCERAGSAVLVEVGSLKAAVAAFAETAPGTARIVGAHPMAGATTAGFTAARADLFRERPFLIVPTARSDTDAMAVAGDIARDAGGVATVCSTVVHDRAMAHLLAAPLAAASALALSADGAGPLLGLAGPGFRDTTRLAGTPLDLAEQLLGANAGNVVAALAALRTALQEIEGAVADGDRDALRTLLGRAADVRRRLDP
jgi:prephenate dehydrogenase